MLPDEPTEEDRQEELPQDNQTPFQPADPSQDDTRDNQDQAAQAQAGTLDDTHPATDTNIDPQELYDEGLAGAAEANEPNAGNAVTDLHVPSETDNNEDPEEAAI